VVSGESWPPSPARSAPRRATAGPRPPADRPAPPRRGPCPARQRARQPDQWRQPGPPGAKPHACRSSSSPCRISPAHLAQRPQLRNRLLNCRCRLKGLSCSRPPCRASCRHACRARHQPRGHTARARTGLSRPRAAGRSLDVGQTPRGGQPGADHRRHGGWADAARRGVARRLGLAAPRRRRLHGTPCRLHAQGRRRQRDQRGQPRQVLP
jgi:hypothetical protein